ncbi:MAG: PLP-dependent lyase/thiolase [Bdellovibrionales bacterium]|nr:PLP-dependent lyase/thiolase [Bdellovibrionales bacterium]
MALSPTEREILSRIPTGSDHDPLHPEFPPNEPRFPATPTRQIEVPGFSNVWLKDESVNPSGTHKDRMAWEIIRTYRDFLRAKEAGFADGPLPEMSIISHGSAAIAIQQLLRLYGLPNLRVIVDVSLPRLRADILQQIGCRVYEVDLAHRTLYWQDVLRITENPTGMDITSSAALDPTSRFYDWMAYEILNECPTYCFVPFGTGNLFENIFNVLKHEVMADVPDPRLKVDINQARRCNILAATIQNMNSKACSLYSSRLPYVNYSEHWMRFYRKLGCCGPDSGVKILDEEYLDHALQIAADQGIRCEAAGIAGLALMLQRQDRLPRDQKMLLINTGRTRLLFDGILTEYPA